MSPYVDQYLAEGCGRCPLGGTPQCKVHTWQDELIHLRMIVNDSGLNEEYKWKQPCYTFEDNNVLLVTAFKNYATLAFFKGALLKDPKGILVAPGENSQAVRQLRFTSVAQITSNETSIRAYIKEAIDIEKKGLKIEFKKQPEAILEELEAKFEEDPAFQAAFEALTPGRQRGYLLHFSAAKQSQTRVSRIEKAMEKIFEGKGWNER